MARCLLALLGCFTSVAQAAEPLITTDIVYSTYEHLKDLHDHAWTMVPTEPALAKLKEIQQQVEKQVGPLPPQVEEAKTQAMVAMVQAKALAEEFRGKAYEQGTQVALQIIQALETAVPSSKGLIRKSLGDLVVTVCYLSLVAYILLKVLLFGLRTVLFFFCGFCCCRFCCGRKAATKTKAASKKAAAKSAAAAPKPAATAAKPVPAKTNGKKK